MRRPLTLILLLAAFAACSGVVAASASASNPVIDDCTSSVSGDLTQRYTVSQLTNALKSLTGDTLEYTGCGAAIKKQLRQLQNAARSPNTGGNGGQDTTGGGAGGVGGGGTSGGATSGGSSGSTGSSSAGGATGGKTTGSTANGSAGTTSTPASTTPPPAPTASDAPVQLAGTTVTPTIPAALGEQGSSLPTPLIVFLALLGVGALAVAGTTIGRRVLARRRG